MKWRLFVCSDCDAGNNKMILQVPADAPYEYGCPIDTCPNCGSFNSLLGRDDVEVTTLAYGRPVT